MNIQKDFSLRASLTATCRPVAILLVLMAGNATAGEWLVAPRLSLSGIVSDNITLASPGSESKEYVGRTVPGVSVSGKGRRLNLDLDYQLENLIYAGKGALSRGSETIHMARVKGEVEAVKELVFIEMRGGFSPKTIDTKQRIASDNINLTGNRVDVFRGSVSPYLAHDFGREASVELRYRFDYVDSKEAGERNDSRTNTLSFGIDNRHSRSLLRWDLNHKTSTTKRKIVSDSERASTDGRVSYQLWDEFSLLVRGGDEKNNVAGIRRSVNGTWWAAGFIWKPSPNFVLESTFGKKAKDTSITWAPLSRTSFQLAYSDREIALNPGVTWSGTLRHRMRHSNWTLGYSEVVTNVQQLQVSGEEFFLIPDGNGSVIFDPDTGLPLVFVQALFSLTDEEFIRQRTNFGVSFSKRKNDIALGVYSENREFSLSSGNAKSYGGNLSWSWRFASRTYSSMSVNWQRVGFRLSERQDELLFGRIGINRSLSAYTTGKLEYQRTTRESLLSSAEYRENRLMASIEMNFGR